MFDKLNNPSRNINNDYNNKDMTGYPSKELSELRDQARKEINKLKAEINKLKAENCDLRRNNYDKDSTIELLEQTINRFHISEDGTSEKVISKVQNETVRPQKVSTKKILPKIKNTTQVNATVETSTENRKNIHPGNLSHKKEVPFKKETQTKHIIKAKTSTASRKKIFFSMPENDGRFIVNNGEPSNDGRKYFRIEYIEGSETGELYYISGDRDKRVINRLESYLKPVCDIDNIINADSATSIEFKTPGKVSLRNDSWVIDSNNKAQIKLL